MSATDVPEAKVTADDDDLQPDRRFVMWATRSWIRPSVGAAPRIPDETATPTVAAAVATYVPEEPPVDDGALPPLEPATTSVAAATAAAAAAATATDVPDDKVKADADPQPGLRGFTAWLAMQEEASIPAPPHVIAAAALLDAAADEANRWNRATELEQGPRNAAAALDAPDETAAATVAAAAAAASDETETTGVAAAAAAAAAATGVPEAKVTAGLRSFAAFQRDALEAMAHPRSITIRENWEDAAAAPGYRMGTAVPFPTYSHQHDRDDDDDGDFGLDRLFSAPDDMATPAAAAAPEENAEVPERWRQRWKWVRYPPPDPDFLRLYRANVALPLDQRMRFADLYRDWGRDVKDDASRGDGDFGLDRLFGAPDEMATPAAAAAAAAATDVPEAKVDAGSLPPLERAWFMMHGILEQLRPQAPDANAAATAAADDVTWQNQMKEVEQLFERARATGPTPAVAAAVTAAVTAAVDAADAAAVAADTSVAGAAAAIADRAFAAFTKA